MSMNNFLSDDYEIINEKRVTLQYSTDDSEEEYNILIQLCNNDFILINARREQISESFYETRMNMDEFKNLNSKLLKFCESIQEIYTLLSDSFDDNKFIIKDIRPTKLKLETTVQITRSMCYSLELNLNKKKSETDDTVKMLCETITKLENEKKDLIHKINQIEEKINELSRVPEFYLDKFSIIIHYNNQYYKTVESEKWKYTQTELDLNSELYAIISINMENNIIIFYGSKAPANSYYVSLNNYYNNNVISEGIYYENKYICPHFNNSHNNGFGNSGIQCSGKVFCLYGKLKI